MNDTIVTVVGNFVDSPRRVRLDSGSVTNFRMASTARRYDAGRQEFVDAGTFWVDVECWGELGGHVSSSVSKGDPVILHGALTTHSWETENGRRSTPRIKAFAVGPNLARGSAQFTRSRPQRGVAPAEEVPAGPLSATPTAPQEEEFDEALSHARLGRDYVPDPETAEQMPSDALPREPVHV